MTKQDMRLDHRLESSPKSDHDEHQHKTDGDDQESSPRIPNFQQLGNSMNGHKLHLPEESKADSVPRNSVFKIDFSNDPVMRSLLEAKQDQCALALQSMYLSKK